MALVIWVDPEDASEAGKEHGKGSRLPIAAKDKSFIGDKLEVNVDGAWYSAELSLSKDGITRVQCEGSNGDQNAEKDTDFHHDWDAEKIKSLHPLHDHIRVRSQALQHDACKFVRVRSLAWATKSPKENCAYYDAFVHKMRTNVHEHGPDGETCNCTFTVEWLHGPHKGRKSTLRSRNITKLHSTKDVETHPLIVESVCHAYADDVVSLSDSEHNNSDEVEWVPHMARHQVSRQGRKPSVPPVKVGRLKRLARAKIPQVNDDFTRVPWDTELRDVPSRSHITEQDMCSGPPSRKMRGHLPFADGMERLLTPHPLRGAGFTIRGGDRTRRQKGRVDPRLGSC